MDVIKGEGGRLAQGRLLPALAGAAPVADRRDAIRIGDQSCSWEQAAGAAAAVARRIAWRVRWPWSAPSSIRT